MGWGGVLRGLGGRRLGGKWVLLTKAWSTPGQPRAACSQLWSQSSGHSHRIGRLPPPPHLSYSQYANTTVALAQAGSASAHHLDG